MIIMKIKVVIITDGNEYIVHGSSSETPAEMFKALAPIWGLDPATESAHYVELTVAIPELETRTKSIDDVTDPS